MSFAVLEEATPKLLKWRLKRKKNEQRPVIILFINQFMYITPTRSFHMKARSYHVDCVVCTTVRAYDLPPPLRYDTAVLYYSSGA